MRIFAVIAMLIACLVYGFMPARAMAFGETVTVQQITVKGMTDRAHSSHHGMMKAEKTAQVPDDPCPHRGGPVHGSFCAACLAIVPMADTPRDGHPPFSWPKPEPARELAAFSPAPADPPPRF